MDDSENWKVVQTKTFTKWVNTKLKKAGFPMIESLFTDLSSGVALANLLHALGKDVSGYNESPRSRIQKMENLKIILDFIKDLNVSLVNIGPEDIVDGDQKLTLGLIWTLISKLSISEMLSSEFFTMREEILNWTQKVTEGYKNVHIQDLASSWQDGLGFNAIIHKFRPQFVPGFESMVADDSYANCENAFKIAEEQLEIARLFDPEDIIDTTRPDEKSIVTYLSQFYQKFHAEERQLAARDKIRNIIKALDWSVEARNTYEQRALVFLKEKALVNEKAAALATLLETFVEELRKIREKNTELIMESAELHLLLNDIQDVHRLMSFKSYHPPERCSIDKMDMSFLNVPAIFDLNLVLHETAEFSNPEAVELVKMKDMSNEMYDLSDKEAQIAAMASNEHRFGPVHFSSASKQKGVDKLRELFESKKQKLAKFQSLKNAADTLVANAKKLFAMKDIKRTGKISVVDFKKILRALRFDQALVEDAAANLEGTLTCEKMTDIIVKINYSKAARTQIQNALREIGCEDTVELEELLPNFNPKGLGEGTSIRVEAILSMIDE